MLEITRLLTDLTNAVYICKEKKVANRDIKPGNILIYPFK